MMRVLVALLGCALGAACGAELRAGRAEVDITPPAGMPMGGYFYVRVNTGMHDPLYAKALVLEQGGEKAALVACDLESIPRRFVDEARAIIEKTTGIPGNHVMISATHTHTGPEMGHHFLDRIEGPPAEVARAYRASLAGKIAESVRLAQANLASARVWSGAGREPSLCFNRRFLMRDGTVQFNPGKLNLNIVRPAGPIDPEVPVVYFDSPESKPIATYVNYALHLDTTGGTRFSADYPFTLSKLLAPAKGADMLTLFTIGTAGNINHVDVRSAAPQTSVEEASRIGTILAAEVLRTYPKLQPASGLLQVRREIVQLPVQDLRPGEIEQAPKIVERAIHSAEGANSAVTFLDVVQAFKVLYISEYQGKPIDAEVLVVSLGRDVAWVGLPGEIFVELGMAIKNASPFRNTIIAELASDVIDYVPDRKGFAEGAYETVTARCKPGSGEALVAAATGLLIQAFEQAGAR